MIVCLKAGHVQIIARVDVIAFSPASSSMSASQTSERKKEKKGFLSF